MPSHTPRRILILGGTQFAGAHFVAAALDAGHDVTLVHRGKTRPTFFDPGHARLSTIVGDRDPAADHNALAALDAAIRDGARWDAVVDTCGYYPRVVRASASLLADAAERYVFVSTVSAYDRHNTGGLTEDSPLEPTDAVDPDVEDIGQGRYGPLKVLCEREVTAAFGAERCCIVRPAVIIGPGDPTDRFTYWVRRAALGGAALSPTDASKRIGLVDARDLGAFYLRCVEQQFDGVFNVSGAGAALGASAWLDAVAAGVGADVAWRAHDAKALAEVGVGLWSGLPCFVPSELEGLSDISAERASAAGLTLRSIESTARDLHAWDVARGAPALVAGMSSDVEAEALAALSSQVPGLPAV